MTDDGDEGGGVEVAIQKSGSQEEQQQQQQQQQRSRRRKRQRVVKTGKEEDQIYDNEAERERQEDGGEESGSDDVEEWECDEQLYCFCRKPWGGRFMIGCEMCGEWFHGDCVGVEEPNIDAIDAYVCDECEKNKMISCDDDEVLANKIKSKPGNNEKSNTQKDAGTSNKEARVTNAQDEKITETVASPQLVKNAKRQLTPDKDTELLNKQKEEARKEQVRAAVKQAFFRALESKNEESLDQRKLENVASQIEDHLFKHFGSIVCKEYRAKSRSLAFNLNDKNNLNLRLKVFDGSIAIPTLITMTPEELANSSLKRMRKERAEKVEKMVFIENDTAKSAGTMDGKTVVWKKTRKGDELVELDFGDDGMEVAPDPLPSETIERTSTTKRLSTLSDPQMNASIISQASVIGLGMINETTVGDEKVVGEESIFDSTAHDKDRLVVCDDKVDKQVRFADDKSATKVDSGFVDMNFPCFESFEDFKEKNQDLSKTTTMAHPNDSLSPPSSYNKKTDSTSNLEPEEEYFGNRKTIRKNPPVVPAEPSLVPKTPSTSLDEEFKDSERTLWTGSMKYVQDSLSSSDNVEYTARVVISVDSIWSTQTLPYISLPSSMNVVGRLSCSKVSAFIKQIQSSSKSRAVCVGMISEISSDDGGGQLLASLTENIIKSRKAAVLLRSDQTEIYVVLRSDLDFQYKEDNDITDTNVESSLRVVIIYKAEKPKAGKVVRDKRRVEKEVPELQMMESEKKGQKMSKVPGVEGCKEKVDQVGSKAQVKGAGTQDDTISPKESVQSPNSPQNPVPQLQSLNQLHDFLNSMSGPEVSPTTAGDNSEMGISMVDGQNRMGIVDSGISARGNQNRDKNQHLRSDNSIYQQQLRHGTEVPSQGLQQLPARQFNASLMNRQNHSDSLQSFASDMNRHVQQRNQPSLRQDRQHHHQQVLPPSHPPANIYGSSPHPPFNRLQHQQHMTPLQHNESFQPKQQNQPIHMMHPQHPLLARQQELNNRMNPTYTSDVMRTNFNFNGGAAMRGRGGGRNGNSRGRGRGRGRSNESGDSRGGRGHNNWMPFPAPASKQ